MHLVVVGWPTARGLIPMPPACTYALTPNLSADSSTPPRCTIA